MVNLVFQTKNYKYLLIIFISSLIGGIIGSLIIFKLSNSRSQIFKDFYTTETTVLISPSTLRQTIDKHDGSYVLVDLRTKPEYEQEHIVTAINIPAATLSLNDTLSEFKKLPKDKQIIVYCYSASCMLGRQTGKLLSDNGINVQELNVGWSEWRYYWPLWNPGSTQEAGKNYIVTGSDPGEAPKNQLPPDACHLGGVGC